MQSVMLTDMSVFVDSEQKGKVMGNQSEVAQLKQEIEAICYSLSLKFNGFAHKATHRIISKQYQALDNHREDLADLVGEEQATEITYDIYNKVVN
jgi:hypothetical protein